MKLIMPELGDSELDLIKEVFKLKILTNDKMVRSFEEKVADYVGVKHAIGVSNGTSALHLALIAAGIKKDDEVIVPSMAFPGTINALLYLKAKPVIVDININTLNIESRFIEEKITTKTKAILPVDLFGLPVDMDKIRVIAEKYNLKIIEDASYAFGSEYKGSYCGSLADVAVYSFNERRIITCGEGGIVVTNDKKMADAVRLLRNHAMEKEGKDQEAKFLDVGFNYRLSEIHAAIGLAQMDKISIIIEKRRYLAGLYNKFIDELPNVTPPREPLDCKQNYSNYVIKLDVHMDTDNIKRRLRERDIPTTIGTYCIHKQPMYNITDADYPVAEYAYKYGICLPLNGSMNNDDVYYICEMLERFVV